MRTQKKVTCVRIRVDSAFQSDGIGLCVTTDVGIAAAPVVVEDWPDAVVAATDTELWAPPLCVRVRRHGPFPTTVHLPLENSACFLPIHDPHSEWVSQHVLHKRLQVLRHV